MADMERYVVKDNSLPLLLDRMNSHGVKTFLLTNSGFEYSNVRVLAYIYVLMVHHHCLSVPAYIGTVIVHKFH